MDYDRDENNRNVQHRYGDFSKAKTISDELTRDNDFSKGMHVLRPFYNS